ncbi:F-box/LRR-repeat protein 3-like [Lycium ferocissimum]|uniref:F-box/LRR-repeat protein 3-like n=1 Tax=Lycium ferocissimum TaxID=112874 RepID=UPI0028157000|nr:F-box/LRR-repeat protein 3-like [Lycium ferocissimum]
MPTECKYFPEECWEQIFSRLPHQSDLESVSLVCKQFLALTNRICLHLSVIHHDTLSKLIHRFPNLISIDLSDFHSDLDLILFELANCVSYIPNLRQLDFSRQIKLPIEGLKELGRKFKGLRVFKCRKLAIINDSYLNTIAESFAFLEELDISYPRPFDRPPNPSELDLTDSGIEFLSVNLTNMRKINISGNYRITDRSLVALSMNCLNLQAIQVEDCALLTLKEVLSMQRACAALSWISVSNIHNGLSSSGFKCLTTSSRALQTLGISNSIISDELLFLLAKASLPLYKLSLSWYFLTDESINDLSQYLQSLVTIYLSNCVKLSISTFFTLATNCPSLEDVCMKNIRLRVKDCFHNGAKNPRIRTVNLQRNSYLDDDSLTKIALMCPNMESLYVCLCRSVIEAGIASALEVCNHIRNLEFVGCPLIKHIGNGAELPNLEVINAADSTLSDEGLAIIGSRCSRLLKLNLHNYEGVTIEGIQAMVKNCTSLREINLKRCVQVSVNSLNSIVSFSSSLRRVFPPKSDGFHDSLRGFSWHNGCLVSSSCKMSFELITLRFYQGGLLKGKGKERYVGGEVTDIYDVDIDKFPTLN